MSCGFTRETFRCHSIPERHHGSLGNTDTRVRAMEGEGRRGKFVTFLSRARWEMGREESLADHPFQEFVTVARSVPIKRREDFSSFSFLRL